MAKKPLKPGQQALVWAVVVSVCAWFVPFASLLLLPIVAFNTHIHELCHALSALATGGSVDWIKVFSDGSGLTQSRGGLHLAIIPAGYLGAAALGAVMIGWAHTEKRARQAVGTLAVVLALSSLLWVRGDVLGWLSGVFWVLVLAWLAFSGKGMGLLFAVQFLGVQQCLAAVLSLLVLFHINATANIQNDAKMMGDITGIPGVFWAGLWIGLALSMMAIAVRNAARSR